MPKSRFANRIHTLPFLRRTLLGALMLLLFLVPSVAGAASCPTVPLPPQGVYEGCAPGAGVDRCIQRLEQISAAGFRYVLNYSAWYGSPESVLRYADAAQALGLSLIWPLNQPAWSGEGSLSGIYSKFSEGQSLSNQEFTSFAIGLVADHPATWGFYIGDEASPGEAGTVDAIRNLSETVRSLAPTRQQLYISRPGSAQVRPFLELPDVVGTDPYPVSQDPLVRQSAKQTQDLANHFGVETAMVIQAFAWSEYQPSRPDDFPTRQEMLAMRNSTLRYASPTMILWYSYQDIARSDDPEGHWEDLQAAAFSPFSPTACAPEPNGLEARRVVRW